MLNSVTYVSVSIRECIAETIMKAFVFLRTPRWFHASLVRVDVNKMSQNTAFRPQCTQGCQRP